MTSNITVLSGPSSVGKSTIIEQIRQQNQEVFFSISATTRPQRNGEVEGRDYYFVSDQKFDEMLEQNEFLEWAVVHKNYRYGTPRHSIDEAAQRGQAILIEVDIAGAEQIRQKVPDCKFVFIRPKNFQVLIDRIKLRASETEAEQEIRLNTARVECAEIDKFQYTILNDDLESAVAELQKIINL